MLLCAQRMTLRIIRNIYISDIGRTRSCFRVSLQQKHTDAGDSRNSGDLENAKLKDKTVGTDVQSKILQTTKLFDSRQIGITRKLQRKLVCQPVAQPEDPHIGKVAIIGVPNVGKSSVANRLLTWKFSAVSSKINTTRQRTLGVLTRDNRQLIFLDTPGMIKPFRRKEMNLERSLLTDPHSCLFEADINSHSCFFEAHTSKFSYHCNTPSTSEFVFARVLCPTYINIRPLRVVVVIDGSLVWERHSLDRDIIKVLNLHNHKKAVLVVNKVDLYRDKADLLHCIRILTKGVVGGRTDYYRPKQEPSLLAKSRLKSLFDKAKDRLQSNIIELRTLFYKVEKDHQQENQFINNWNTDTAQSGNAQDRGSNLQKENQTAQGVNTQDRGSNHHMENQTAQGVNTQDRGSNHHKENKTAQGVNTQDRGSNLGLTDCDMQPSQNSGFSTESPQKSIHTFQDGARANNTPTSGDDVTPDHVVALRDSTETAGYWEDDQDCSVDAMSDELDIYTSNLDDPENEISMIEDDVRIIEDDEEYTPSMTSHPFNFDRHDGTKDFDDEKVQKWFDYYFRQLREIEALTARDKGYSGFDRVFVTCATTGLGVDELRDYLLASCQPGMWQFPDSVITDSDPLALAVMCAKEALLDSYAKQLPYCVEPVVTSWYQENHVWLVNFDIVCPSKYEMVALLHKGGDQISLASRRTQQELMNIFRQEFRVRFRLRQSPPKDFKVWLAKREAAKKARRKRLAAQKKGEEPPEDDAVFY